METKEDMINYHKMLNGKVVWMETMDKTIQLNEKYIAFLQRRIKETEELVESIRIFLEK